MAEYIEREVAIEKITAYCELRQAIYENRNDEFLRGLQTALTAITYVIPAADVQPVDRWISVEDSLPEERKRVLAYNEGGITIAWRDKGEWDDIFLTVTHWQPLPEPPKEGDTE